MYRLITFAFIVLLFCPLYSQTKLIAHKSHGGTAENFLEALEEEDRLLTYSDFGAAPVHRVSQSQLDSVIFISKKEAIMITSGVDYYSHEADKPPYDTVYWQPGRETVIDHPLFRYQHRLDWIKEQLDQHYNFTNPANSVVFIGFDNAPPQREVEPENSRPTNEQEQQHPAPTPPPNNQDQAQFELSTETSDSSPAQPYWVFAFILPALLLVRRLRG
ncbi:MAG: hypothetical protein AAFO91_05945 [Bacteroidota bacterium]